MNGIMNRLLSISSKFASSSFPISSYGFVLVGDHSQIDISKFFVQDTHLFDLETEDIIHTEDISYKSVLGDDFDVEDMYEDISSKLGMEMVFSEDKKTLEEHETLKDLIIEIGNSDWNFSQPVFGLFFSEQPISEFPEDLSDPTVIADLSLSECLYLQLMYNSSGEVFNEIAVLQQLAEMAPSSKCYHDLGKCYDIIGEREQSIKMAEKALEYNSTHEACLQDLGYAYLNSHDIISLQKHADRMYDIKDELSKNTESVINYFYGAISYDNEEFVESMKYATESLEINPNFQRSLVLRSMIYEHIDDLESAIEDLRNCVEIDKNYPTAHQRLFVYLMEEHQFPEAIECVNNVISYFESGELMQSYILDISSSHQYRAVAYMSDGQFDKAIEDYTLCLEYSEEMPQVLKDRNPMFESNFKVLLNDRGLCFYLNGQLDLALKDFERILELYPDDEDVKNVIQSIKASIEE